MNQWRNDLEPFPGVATDRFAEPGIRINAVVAAIRCPYLAEAGEEKCASTRRTASFAHVTPAKRWSTCAFAAVVKPRVLMWLFLQTIRAFVRECLQELSLMKAAMVADLVLLLQRPHPLGGTHKAHKSG
jgi:hypothetical protein